MLFQDILDKLPNCQNTMADSVASSAKYCMNERPELNTAPVAIPARIIVSGVASIAFSRRSVTPTESMANMKAQNVTENGSATVCVAADPAPKNIIERPAPNAAAFDMPRV